jgi:DNA mismatch repair protein MutS
MQLTPMMQQYMNIKQDYPDCILFFRLGDFYEMFFEDALIASQDMEVTLTGKSCGLEERAPMCGVPYHAVDSYVAKLIDKGHKVAICEQMEDPATTKGIVKREVVRIITPGTLMNRGLLNEKESNYLAAVSFGDSGQTAGIAYCDLSTGEIGAAEYKGKRALGQLDSQIARLSLSELVLADQPLDSETDNWLSGLQCALTRRPTFDFSAGEAEKTIRRSLRWGVCWHI